MLGGRPFCIMDFIWNELRRAMCDRNKFLSSVPYIMYMIERVTKVTFLKDCKHESLHLRPRSSDALPMAPHHAGATRNPRFEPPPSTVDASSSSHRGHNTSFIKRALRSIFCMCKSMSQEVNENHHDIIEIKSHLGLPYDPYHELPNFDDPFTEWDATDEAVVAAAHALLPPPRRPSATRSRRSPPRGQEIFDEEEETEEEEPLNYQVLLHQIAFSCVQWVLLDVNTVPYVAKLFSAKNPPKEIKDKGKGFLCNEYYINKSSASPRHGPSWHSRLPGHSHLQTHQVGARNPTPRISTAPGRNTRLEGGRIQVTLTMKTKPDQESYMTEYAAIRIVFTLQGLYTCTNLTRSQPGANRLTPRHRSTKLAATAPILPFRVWDASSLKRLPRNCDAYYNGPRKTLQFGGREDSTSSPYTDALSSYRHGAARH
ncbi:actin-like protein ARP8 [Panicum miliaceum]|uniref:Actin-like protein ARP8 n=1 Tax=Panicum miliaceum TaxID=4540 RepID=A0A3L6Q3V9_PANMI|nr:actin-like protein ARP8 [Panicum miliaceum]